MPSSYASLADCASIMTATNTISNTDQQDRLLRCAYTATRRIDGLMYSRLNYFAPNIETRSIPVTQRNVNGALGVLQLNSPLLSFTSVSLSSTGNPSVSNTVNNVSLYPPNQSPAQGLSIGSCCGTWWSVCSGCFGGALFAAVTGAWGYNKDYANAFPELDTITTVGGINASVTSFTVADADGDDEYFTAPRFSRGQLLQVETEWMELRNVDYATNTLTVARGVNGSTAAAHIQTTPVAVYRPDDVIRWATARQAGLLYARQGAYTTVEVQPNGSEIRYPVDLLVELRASLQEYAYGVQYS